jgi:hypothetical protein
VNEPPASWEPEGIGSRAPTSRGRERERIADVLEPIAHH